MPASNAFVEGLLDVVDEVKNSARFSNEWAIEFVEKICKIPAGNQSVAITQQRLRKAANLRWSDRS